MNKVHQFYLLILIGFAISASSCVTHPLQTTMNEGEIVSDLIGLSYKGPQYNIAIMMFENKVPDKMPDGGKAARDIFKKQAEASGINILMTDNNAYSETIKSISQQANGATETKNIDPSTTALIDFILSGTISSYSEVEEGIDAITYQKRSIVSRVSLDYSLVDAATGKVLLSGSSSGKYRKIITSQSEFDSKSTLESNLREGSLSNALGKIVTKLIPKLDALPYQGRLIAVNEHSMTLRAGIRSQLKVGNELVVYHPGEEIRDPYSRKILGRKEERIGIIKIVLHQGENISEASVVSGSGFKIGDIARPLQ